MLFYTFFCIIFITCDNSYTLSLHNNRKNKNKNYSFSFYRGGNFLEGGEAEVWGTREKLLFCDLFLFLKHSCSLSLTTLNSDLYSVLKSEFWFEIFLCNIVKFVKHLTEKYLTLQNKSNKIDENLAVTQIIYQNPRKSNKFDGKITKYFDGIFPF